MLGFKGKWSPSGVTAHRSFHYSCIFNVDILDNQTKDLKARSLGSCVVASYAQINRNGLFSLPDTDSDSIPNGYIVLCSPIITANYRNGIGIRVHTEVRPPQCKRAIKQMR